MCASPQKRPYPSAMTSVSCATQKSTLTVAWRFASWPRAMYKSLLLLYLLSSNPHFFFPKCKDKELNVLLLSALPKKKENVIPCARPVEKMHGEHTCRVRLPVKKQ